MYSDQVNHSSSRTSHHSQSHQMPITLTCIVGSKKVFHHWLYFAFVQWMINMSFYFLVLISILWSNVHCTSMSIENIFSIFLATNVIVMQQVYRSAVLSLLFVVNESLFWISVFIFMYYFCLDCSYGLQTGLISDSRVSSSSVLNGKFLAPYGRLRNRTSAWCARGYEKK